MPNATNLTRRLFLTIKQAAPQVQEIEIGTFGNPATVKVFPPTEQSTAQPAIDTFDWTQPAQDTFDNNQARLHATNDVDNSRAPVDKKLRATLITAVDEINTLRQWLTQFKIEVAAASSLADLKTRVATLPNTPERTTQQAYNAIKAKMLGGTVD